MWGHPLHIEQFSAGILQNFDAVDERGLRGIGFGVEHRFTGEELAKTHSVDATNQFTGVVSGLD